MVNGHDNRSLLNTNIVEILPFQTPLFSIRSCGKNLQRGPSPTKATDPQLTGEYTHKQRLAQLL